MQTRTPRPHTLQRAPRHNGDGDNNAETEQARPQPAHEGDTLEPADNAASTSAAAPTETPDADETATTDRHDAAPPTAPEQPTHPQTEQPKSDTKHPQKKPERRANPTTHHNRPGGRGAPALGKAAHPTKGRMKHALARAMRHSGAVGARR